MPKYNPLIQSLEKPDTDVFVYGLLDPDTNELRYIGQTVQGFRRIREHYNHCNRVNKDTGYFSRSKNWIKSLIKNNKIFKVVYLEYCEENELDDLEVFYINYFKSIGANLINHYTGGSPNRSKTWDEEARKLVSERTKEAMNNPITKEKCRQNALKTVAGYNKGKKFSQEFKDKISKSQEHKAWRFQLDDGPIYIGLHKAAKAYGCTFSMMSKLANGKVKSVNGLNIKFWKV